MTSRGVPFRFPMDDGQSFACNGVCESIEQTFSVTGSHRLMLRGKAEWVESVRSGREKFESVELYNLTVHSNGDIATLIGQYTQKATKDSKDDSGSGSYVGTWVMRNGRWQLVSSVFP